MKIQKVASMKGMQDGAIWGKYLFRFDANGEGFVYDLDTVQGNGEPLEVVAQFMLDRADEIPPHSNAVVFGTEYFSPEDEYPLLYSNMYNNFSEKDDPMNGVCCVYRLQKEGDTFKTTLVQLIKVGFADQAPLWLSSTEGKDVRPYGNFVIDRDTNRLVAFVMRDADRTTRYFTFDLPKCSDGQPDATYSVPKVTLQKEDILSQFDCEYHHFIQGACAHGGKVYSVEGFHLKWSKETPALRVIDLEKQTQELLVNFPEYGEEIEPELIDFRGETCYYSNSDGELFTIEF